MLLQAVADATSGRSFSVFFPKTSPGPRSGRAGATAAEHPCPAEQAGLSALRRTTWPGSRAARLSASVSGLSDQRATLYFSSIPPSPSTFLETYNLAAGHGIDVAIRDRVIYLSPRFHCEIGAVDPLEDPGRKNCTRPSLAIAKEVRKKLVSKCGHSGPISRNRLVGGHQGTQIAMWAAVQAALQYPERRRSR